MFSLKVAELQVLSTFWQASSSPLDEIFWLCSTKICKWARDMPGFPVHMQFCSLHLISSRCFYCFYYFYYSYYWIILLLIAWKLGCSEQQLDAKLALSLISSAGLFLHLFTIFYFIFIFYLRSSYYKGVPPALREGTQELRFGEVQSDLQLVLVSVVHWKFIVIACPRRSPVPWNSPYSLWLDFSVCSLLV